MKIKCELTAIFHCKQWCFPGDELNLPIFEPRYKELINDCAETKMSCGNPAADERPLQEPPWNCGLATSATQFRPGTGRHPANPQRTLQTHGAYRRGWRGNILIVPPR